MFGYVYLIVNKVNGKTYIGQREYCDIFSKDQYMGSGVLLKKAKEKYGTENFEKFLIQYCNSKEELNKQEKFWIAEYRNRGKAEYNIADGGQGGGSYRKGTHVSEEQKIKESITIREQYKNGRHPWNYETKGVMKAWNKNKKGIYSEETLEKMRKPKSEETKNKISQSKKGKKIGPCKEETKKRISQAKKGCIGKSKGTHWFNDGIRNVRALECPEGFVPGKLQGKDKK